MNSTSNGNPRRGRETPPRRPLLILLATALLALLAGCGGDDKSDSSTNASVDSSNSNPVPAAGEIDPSSRPAPTGRSPAATTATRSTRR